MVSSVQVLLGGPLEVGSDTFVGHQTLLIGGASRITIGNCCDISSRVTIATGSHKIDPVGPHSAGEGFSEDVVIEDGCWIGLGVTILGGVTIGRKAIVGAGSVVTKSIPANTIACGVPCKVIKRYCSETKLWVVESRGK